MPERSWRQYVLGLVLLETGAEREDGHWQGNQALYEMAPSDSVREEGRWLSFQVCIWRDADFPTAAQEWTDEGAEEIEADVKRFRAQLGGKDPGPREMWTPTRLGKMETPDSKPRHSSPRGFRRRIKTEASA